MGQRHQTYCLCELYNVDNTVIASEVRVYHNQWDYPTIQPFKVIRFWEMFKKWQKDKVLIADPIDAILLYRYSASLSPQTMSHHTDITTEYMKSFSENVKGELQEYQGGAMYGEDNNDGWKIIYIRAERNPKNSYKPIWKCNIGFRMYDANGKGAYNKLSRYLYRFVDEDKEHKNLNEYISNSFNKPEQKLFWEIDESFNLAKIKKAERIIENHIKKLNTIHIDTAKGFRLDKQMFRV